MKKLLTMFVATLFLVACNTDKSAKCSASTKCDANTNVSICTFNIMIQGQKPYIKKDGTDLSWNKRLPLIASFVKTNDFDVIGCQEPIPAQVEDVKKAIEKYDLYYKPVRTNMTPSPCNPIYFKKAKYELLDKGEFYYSRTPEVESNDWDSPRSRCCTWVKLREKKSGKEFYVFNTHFTHIGNVAKAESAKVLTAKIKEIAKGAPSFAMGDLNSYPTYPGIVHIVNSGVLKDSKVASMSEPVGNGPSFHGFRAKEDPKVDRIDFIFVSPQVEVKSYCLDKKKYGAIQMSDHYPVHIKATF